MNRSLSPYACHVFVCVNDRHGERKSCADGVETRLKDALKAGAKERGWSGRVRVSSSGCMGLCARGPNVLLYPQGIAFHAVAPDDCATILDEIGRHLAG
ncbi:MAG: (2Fe-2S) ferredoxin domain-containing protein [Kiritimatiellia bacterium]|nr:(2Fe-2S) ferredoxin domain-containing protein [Kiritimatiellia bacterium]